jgi:hypothetical protein
MATAVFGHWPRAASAGSLGRASAQALIGQSPLPVMVANVHDGDCGFWSLARAASAGSLGRASAQALIGQSPLPFLLFAICLARRQA